MPHIRAPMHFGTRITVFFLIKTLTEYARHQVNVSTDVSPEVKSALDALLALLPELLALNEPGPN